MARNNRKLGNGVIWLVFVGLVIISGMIGQIGDNAAYAGIGIGVALIVVAMLVTMDKNAK